MLIQTCPITSTQWIYKYPKVHLIYHFECNKFTAFVLAASSFLKVWPANADFLRAVIENIHNYYCNLSWKDFFNYV